MPLMVNNLQNDRLTLDEDVCYGFGILNHLLQSASIYTVTVISVDRYVTIIHCLKQSSWSQYKYILVLLLFVWTASFSVTFPTLYKDYGHITYDSERYVCVPNWEKKGHIILINALCLYIIPIFIMAFCYIKIIGVARDHARKISDMSRQINKNVYDRGQNNSGVFGTEMIGSVHKISMISFPLGKSVKPINDGFLQMSHRVSERSLSRFEREARAAVRLVGLVISFLCCWTPYLAINCALGYGYPKESIPKWLLGLSVWLLFFHSAFNPFLYAIMSKRFRFALKRLLSKWFRSMIRAEPDLNCSEVRSKWNDTENMFKTVSMAAHAKRMTKLNTIHEAPNNKLSITNLDNDEINVHRLSGMSKWKSTTTPQTDLYLSVPQKSFTNGKGALRIETIKCDNNGDETISSRIIKVHECSTQELADANNASSNIGIESTSARIIRVSECSNQESSKPSDSTKIRICVDFTP
ncbi:5-hydroxytryptamine receptor 7-like [Mytilus trossulus]|uniref:5-hydroxytryptamine receptor 7-like n=1 Tax=Mytilus trossulus TaxID=6551 RepID=UPI003006AAC2